MTREISSISYHGVPWWKDDLIITLVNLYKFLGCQSLGYHHLIHEPIEEIGCREWLQPERYGKASLVEPPVGHHKETLLSAVLAPRILHLVTQGLPALEIEMDTRDDHCMSHCRLIRVQAVGFRKRKRNVKGVLHGS
jgi:hypothetical protein